MKKLTTGLMMMAVVALVAPAWGMGVDDIIELCNAGFSPDRIARIVEATGLDEPLEASDWARLKSEGCGDEVVDALLVLMTSEEGAEVVEDDDNRYDDGNVNVYLNSGWGWSGWYGSMFWGGGWDPWWNVGYGYGYASPWYGWYDPWFYADPWFYRPFHFGHWYGYHNPYNYCGGYYTGGYYYSGAYQRSKAMRRGSEWTKASRYASLKSSPAIEKSTFASAKVNRYRDGAVAKGLRDNSAVGYSKTTRTAVRTANGPNVKGKSTVTARSTNKAIRPSTGQVRSPQSTTTKSTVKRRSTGTSTPTNTGTVTRSKTKVKSGTGTTQGTKSTAKRKGTGATNTGKAPAVTPPNPDKPSSQSYRAQPSYRQSSTGRAPSMSAPRSSSGHGSSGTARVKHK